VARDFERGSSEYIHTSIGALDHTGSGGNTMAVVARFESFNTISTLLALSNSTPAFRVRLGHASAGGSLFLEINGGANSSYGAGLALSTWYLLAVTKPGGSSVARFHVLDMAAGTWTHANGTGSSGDHGAPGGTGIVQIGRNNAANHFDGRMALAAAWKRELSDAQVESLGGGFRAWLSQKPDGLWPLNQGAVGTGVVDWTGGGANQSAISGTTISADHPVRWRWGGTVRQVRRAAGATTYNQSVAGTLTSAGGLVRRVAKSPSGALTSAGAVVRLAAKSLTGALTSGGALVNQVARSLAGTLTSAGGLAKAPATTFAGSITPTGALTRRADKPLGGTLTTAGGLVKQVTHALTGTLTTAGDVAKQAARALAGTLTSGGTLANVTVAVLTLAGTLTSAGGLAKQAARTLAGTLTSSGALANIKVAVLALTGALSTAGSLTRQTARTLTGTLTSAGGLTRLASRTLTGTLAASGAVAKQAGRTFAGTLTTAGGLAKQASKALAGALTSAGGLANLAIQPRAYFIGAVLATIRDGGAAALADAINGAASMTTAERGAARLADRAGGAASGTDRSGGAASGAGKPPE
jgi:hypothetical protein